MAALARAVSLEPDNWRHHFRLRSSAGARPGCARRAARWRCCPAFRWRTGLPPRCTSRGRTSTRPKPSCGRASRCRPRRAARPSSFLASRSSGCSGLIELSRGDEDAALSASSASWRSRARTISTRASAARTPGMPIGAVHLRRGRREDAHARSGRRSIACRATRPPSRWWRGRSRTPWRNAHAAARLATWWTWRLPERSASQRRRPSEAAAVVAGALAGAEPGSQAGGCRWSRCSA